MSTGPKTAAGREKCRRARWKHGTYSKEARLERAEIRLLLRESRTLRATLRNG